jgi:hypothetical protein
MPGSRLRTAASAGVTKRENRMINGRTELIAHLGYPTETFTAPMIYNPWSRVRNPDGLTIKSKAYKSHREYHPKNVRRMHACAPGQKETRPKPGCSSQPISIASP